MEKGKIFVIEGTDGSGKQTQTKLLVEYLKQKGKKVITQSFPNYASPSSAPVKMYLQGDLGEFATDTNAYQSSVLFAVDRFCTLKQLQSQIDQGVYVVFDRYTSSNMLHQACKIENENERINFLKWLNTFEFELLGLPAPDKIYFLDIPPEISIALAHARNTLKAGTQKDIHEQDENFLIKSYNCGKQICKMFDWEVINCVNNNGELRCIEDISNEICLKSGI